jgi:hypothetical protein
MWGWQLLTWPVPLLLARRAGKDRLAAVQKGMDSKAARQAAAEHQALVAALVKRLRSGAEAALAAEAEAAAAAASADSAKKQRRASAPGPGSFSRPRATDFF